MKWPFEPGETGIALEASVELKHWHSGPFEAGGRMVQEPPYWSTYCPLRFRCPSGQFALQWRFLYDVIASYKGPINRKSLVSTVTMFSPNVLQIQINTLW